MRIFCVLVALFFTIVDHPSEVDLVDTDQVQEDEECIIEEETVGMRVLINLFKSNLFLNSMYEIIHDIFLKNNLGF